MADDESYGLVMPFVCVESKGGPYSDEAFTAGYRCGLIDAVLESRPEQHRAVIEPALREQVDLIAMRHGYNLTVRYADEHWLNCIFDRRPAFHLFPEDELNPGSPQNREPS